jgi:hypothetical protein
MAPGSLPPANAWLRACHVRVPCDPNSQQVLVRRRAAHPPAIHRAADRVAEDEHVLAGGLSRGGQHRVLAMRLEAQEAAHKLDIAAGAWSHCAKCEAAAGPEDTLSSLCRPSLTVAPRMPFPSPAHKRAASPQSPPRAPHLLPQPRHPHRMLLRGSQNTTQCSCGRSGRTDAYTNTPLDRYPHMCSRRTAASSTAESTASASLSPVPSQAMPVTPPLLLPGCGGAGTRSVRRCSPAAL